MIKAGVSPIVYIIIAVIAMIVNAINKSKKQTVLPPKTSPDAENEHPKPQPSWQKELEDIFGKVLEEKPEVIMEKPKVHETIAETSVKSDQSISKSKEVAYSSNLMSETNAPEEHSLSHIYESIEYEESIIDLEHIELKKVVIYSEIMNRKYF
jgi:hypothetical protein